MATKDSIKITIGSSFDARGVQDAIKAAQDLKAAYAAVAKAQTGGNQGAAQAATRAAQQQAQALGTVANAAKNTDASLLRMARAQATLAGAQGDAKAAADAYAAVLPKLTSGSLQAIQAQTGLQRALNAVNKSAREAGAGTAVLPRTIAGLSHEAASAVKGMLGLGAAIGALKGGYELATMAANAEAARGSFDRMAASAGTSGKALLASLQQASAGTVAQTQLIQSANTALLLLGSDVASKLPQLLEVARASAQALGQDVGYVFNSLVTGISRGSTELIDNAGIAMNATETYATYAASIGKTAEQLTKAEKSQAVLNGVLTAGQAIIAQSGTATETAAVKMQRAAAAFEDLKVAAGAALLPIAGDVAAATTAMLTFGDTSAKVSQDILSGAASFEEYRAKLDAIPDPLAKMAGFYTQLSEAQFTAAQAMIAHGTSAEQAMAAVQGLAAFEVQLTGATEAQRDAFIQLSPAIAEVAASGEYGRAAVQGLLEAFMNGALTADQLAAALANVGNSQNVVVTGAYAAATAQQEAAIAGDYQAQSAAYAAANNVELGGQLSIMAVQAQYAAQQQEYAAQATEASADASILDAAQKEAQALQTQLAAMEAQRAADEFIRLNPTLSASAAASAAAAAGLSPLIAQLVGVTIEANNARAAMAALSGQGGKSSTKGATKGAVGIVGTRAGERRVGVGVGGVVSDEQSAAIARARAAANRAASGTGRAGGGGRGAGGGGAGGAASAAKKRETEAAQNAARLAKIESDLGAKLADIDSATQEKLAAIDARAAEKRAEAARRLNEQIGADAAGFNFDETLNDFDLFNNELKDEQRAALEAREAAEANYQQRVAAAAEEARKIAADGDAEYAQEYYRIKKEQAERAREVEERAAQANRETNGEQADAVAAKAAEATAKAEEEAAREIAVAQAAADARKAAVDEEKNAAIAAAQEQRTAAVDAANEAAAGIKNAAEVGTAAVLAGYQRQMEAIAKARRAAEDYARTVRSLPAPPATSGTSAPPAGTTGGGATTLRGEQGIAAGKGGGEQGAKGASAPGSDLLATIQDALAIVIWLDGVAKDNKWNAANTLPQFVGRMQLAIQALNDIVAVHDIARAPVSPLNADTIRAMVADMTEAVTILGTEATPALNALAQRVSIMANAAKLTTDLLGGMADFRKNIRGDEGALAAPIPAEYIRALVDETVHAVDLFQSAFARTNYGADFRDGVGQWVDNASSILDLLNNAADLGNSLEPPSPPVTPAMMDRLAQTAEQAVQIVLTRLIPLTGQQRDALTEWREQAGAALELLAAAAELDRSTADVDGTVFWSTLNNLADATRDALAVIQGRLTPLTAQEVAALKSWTEGASAAVDIISSAASLAGDIADLKGDGTIPITVLQRLAATSKMALQVVQATMEPATEETAAALERWASSSGAAVDTIAAVASLYGDLKDVPTGSLSANLLIKLAEDARLAVLVIQATLIPQTEQAAEGIQRWGDATRSSVDALTAALDLRQALADSAGSAPPTDAMLLRLADDGRRALMALETKILPVTDQMAEAYGNYADSVGAATSGLSAAFDLSGQMFADYQSPTDAQLNLIATDAQRVVKAVDAAARTFDTAGLEAAQKFGDAYGSIVGAFTDGLQFNAALASGDFVLDTARLATFVDGARQMISATATLGAQAAGIPPAQIAALNSTSAALTGFADAALKMNAVPLNVPQFAGGGGGSSTAITFAPGSIVVQAAPGMNADQVANLAVTKIEAKMRGYR